MAGPRVEAVGYRGQWLPLVGKQRQDERRAHGKLKSTGNVLAWGKNDRLTDFKNICN